MPQLLQALRIPRVTCVESALDSAATNSPAVSNQIQADRLIGGILLGAGNVAMMLGLTCQWDNRYVLMAWTLDTALMWVAGFWLNRLPIRWYAMALALLLVGGRAIHDGAALEDSYHLLLNTRFISLALVSILYFFAGGMYRRRALLMGNPGDGIHAFVHDDLRQTDESTLDPLFGILANVTLLVALSLEIHSWYWAATEAGWTPFADMHMAEMATYSIVWAIYAAIMVVVGFATRYQLFRLLGLAAFGIIVLKVFFVDLESLRWLPRVLALAVLGVTLIGVSMLYQKFFTRTQQSTT